VSRPPKLLGFILTVIGLDFLYLSISLCLNVSGGGNCEAISDGAGVSL
jgi:hypothetical protein